MSESIFDITSAAPERLEMMQFEAYIRFLDEKRAKFDRMHRDNLERCPRSLEDFQEKITIGALRSGEKITHDFGDGETMTTRRTLDKDGRTASLYEEGEDTLDSQDADTKEKVRSVNVQIFEYDKEGRIVFTIRLQTRCSVGEKSLKSMSIVSHGYSSSGEAYSLTSVYENYRPISSGTEGEGFVELVSDRTMLACPRMVQGEIQGESPVYDLVVFYQNGKSIERVTRTTMHPDDEIVDTLERTSSFVADDHRSPRTTLKDYMTCQRNSVDAPSDDTAERYDLQWNSTKNAYEFVT